jgi:DNA repair protein RecO (recombination protein O)
VAAPRGYVSEAVVVRVIPYGETSQVVHLATPEHGLVAALAKGSLRPGPEFQGGVPVGAIGEARLSARRGSDLELLQRFRVKEGLLGLRKDLDRWYAGTYVLELLKAWSKPSLPVPGLYRAATTALRAIAAGGASSLSSWVVWFEARACAAAGHRPMLEACAVCGAAEPRGALFSPLAGGLAHPACAPSGKRRRLTPTALDALRRLYTARLADLAAEPLSPRAVREARAVHDLWIPHLLERMPAGLSTLPRP